MHDDTIWVLSTDFIEKVNIFADIYCGSCRDFFSFIIVFVDFIYADSSICIGSVVHDNMHRNNFYIVFFYKVFRKIGTTLSSDDNLFHVFSTFPVVHKNDNM